jgi:hypothetical protein
VSHLDVIGALETAVGVAFPYGEHLDVDEAATRVVLRHDIHSESWLDRAGVVQLAA